MRAEMKRLPVSARPEPHNRRTATVVKSTGRIGAVAVQVLALAPPEEGRDLVFVASSEHRAERLLRALAGLAPDRPVLSFPAWDCLPYDRAAPSREVMGRRVVALRSLACEAAGAHIVVTTPEAIAQRVPPRNLWRESQLELKARQAFSVADLERYLLRTGYVLDERVDEAGEAALRGQVLDIFPAGDAAPIRIEHQGGRIEGMRRFDPATQLTTGDVEAIVLCPASECVTPAEADLGQRFRGMEHRLADFYPRLESLFDYLPGAMVVLDAGAEDRRRAVLAQVVDGFESRIKLDTEGPDPRPLPDPVRLYLNEAEWHERLAEHAVVRFEETGGPVNGLQPTPSLAARARPLAKFAALVGSELAADRSVVIAAAADKDLRFLARQLEKRLGRTPDRVVDWRAALSAPRGSLLSLRVDLDGGFRDARHGLMLIASADVLGSRAQGAAPGLLRPPQLAATEIDFRLGDVVVHLDHGLGVLRDLEAFETEGDTGDMVRLEYAEGAVLLVPVEEMDRIWRYGAAAESVSLDRLDGEAWAKRRVRIANAIAEAAQRLVELVRARQAKSALKLIPPQPEYEALVARFPFAETPDQRRAIDDTLRDLASGRPMNRLICGDVGFGKTEVAIRAAAAAALSGKQVAIVAPTTVLVRQHVQTFTRRFAGLGIEIAPLSRLVGAAEARDTRRRMAEGSLDIVIGTHALAGRGVRFKDLGLVIIDEEQRFGAAQKARLRALTEDAHVLALTATPIPRTLQAALVGLQDVSVIATPPARRQPIRTFVAPFDGGVVRDALMRERRRDGQSFVVCPRIQDIAPMAQRLRELAPELSIFTAHGRMPADEIDETMVRFADGDADVLLATNLIESGLDVPRANTVLIWRADRFGLAQLHQLRGRVGRGRLRGVAYLFTDPTGSMARSTRKRLETLASLDRLGAGFEISARDLDQRGAGDLFGEDQSGHVKLVGLGLYQHLLQEAVAAAQGKPVEGDWRPELNLGPSRRIPQTYIPEPEVRISLYARLSRLASEDEVDALEDEIEDRFGPLPDPVRHLLLVARVRSQCRQTGIARLDCGPRAVGLTFRAGSRASARLKRIVAAPQNKLEWRGERLVWAEPEGKAQDRLERISLLLSRIAALLSPDRV